jgi:Raf kinase inhibitor-like YbhB/YbcL family protein
MHIMHHRSRPQAQNFSLLLGKGFLVVSLLTLSLLVSFSLTSIAAFAANTTSHVFTISSPDFHNGGKLSKKAEFNQDGCTGSNIAPVLNWTNPPTGTKSFVMLLNDPDAPVAGGFHHWIVYNIPATARQLKGNNAFTEGTNSFGFIGYGGPCPPAGQTHHYHFVLYAINKANIGKKGLSYDQVLSKIHKHILATATIIGTFRLH